MACGAAVGGRGRAARVVATSVALSASTASAVSRLRIFNGCPLETIWIAHEAADSIGPDGQNVEIKSGEHYDFETPDDLLATRYWPKMGCDKNGDNCGLGGSGGPGEACVKTSDSGDVDYSGCAPPIDTKFEASFGVNGEPCDPSVPGGTQMKGCDYIDVSLVDGWTLPFKLEIDGGECKVTSDGVDTTVDSIDCSELHFDDCPKSEDLSAAGFTADLRAINPRTGKMAGCYSPCMLLQDEKWNNSRPRDFERSDEHVAPYCCPTPPETPEACRAGPITGTEFIKTVHKKCPGVYGYAYDDGMGLMRCESSSQYTLSLYCPAALPPDVQKLEEEKEAERKRKAEAEKKRKEEEERKEEQRKKEEEQRKEEQRLKEQLEREERNKEQRAEEAEEDEAQQDSEGFCCFHAKVHDDICGSCHPLGKALPESYCATSRSHCEACGGTGRWCDLGAGDADEAHGDGNNEFGVWTSKDIVRRNEWRRLPRAAEGGRGAAVFFVSTALAASLAASALLAARRAGAARAECRRDLPCEARGLMAEEASA